VKLIAKKDPRLGPRLAPRESTRLPNGARGRLGAVISGAGQLLGTEGFESRNRWKLRPGSTLTGKDWRMEGWGWGWGCQCGAEEIMKMLDHPNLVAITVAWFK